MITKPLQDRKAVDSTQSYTFHDVNLCVEQLCCEKCMHSNMDAVCEFCWGGRNILFKNNVLKTFIELILNEKSRAPNIKEVICIAHNSSGFDEQFILNYLTEKMSIVPKIILNGTKIIVMSIGTKIKFLDSLNYFYIKL